MKKWWLIRYPDGHLMAPLFEVESLLTKIGFS